MADWNSLLDDPVFNMGLDLLSGAPTANPWGAAAEQLNRYQTLRQNREYQQMHSKLYEAQARKADWEAQQAAAAKAQRDAILAGITDPNEHQLAAADMGEWVKSKLKGPDYKVVGNSLIDPNKPNTPVYQAPETPIPFVRAMKAMGIVEGSPEWNSRLGQYLNKESTHAPAPSSTIVLPPLEKAENVEVGKGLGEVYNKIQAAGLTAPARIERAKQMASYLEGYNTGKLTPAGVEIASALKSMGYDIDPNLPNKQAAISMTNQMAMEARNPASGGGLPGATSDPDRNFLVDTVANIGKDPGANRRWIEAQIKLAKRDQDVARLARKYRKKHGTLEGFSEYIEEWANRPENQLFPSEKKAPNITIRSLD